MVPLKLVEGRRPCRGFSFCPKPERRDAPCTRNLPPPPRSAARRRGEAHPTPCGKGEFFAKLSGTSLWQARCDLGQDARGPAGMAGPLLRCAPPRRGPRPAAGRPHRGQALPHRLCRVRHPAGRRGGRSDPGQSDGAERRAQAGHAVCPHGRGMPAQTGTRRRGAGLRAHPAGLLCAPGPGRPRQSAGGGHHGMPQPGRHPLRPAGTPGGRGGRPHHRDAAL